MNKPCNYCEKNPKKIKNYHWYCSTGDSECEKYQEYTKYLRNRSSYKKTEIRLNTIDEVLKEDVVFLPNGIKNRAFVINMQCSTLLNQIKVGVYKVVKK